MNSRQKIESSFALYEGHKEIAPAFIDAIANFITANAKTGERVVYKYDRYFYLVGDNVCVSAIQIPDEKTVALSELPDDLFYLASAPTVRTYGDKVGAMFSIVEPAGEARDISSAVRSSDIEIGVFYTSERKAVYRCINNPAYQGSVHMLYIKSAWLDAPENADAFKAYREMILTGVAPDAGDAFNGAALVSENLMALVTDSATADVPKAVMPGKGKKADNLFDAIDNAF